MEFKKIVDQQVTHYQLHIGGVLGSENYHILSYKYCYLVKDQLRSAEFDRFWKILQRMELKAAGYSGQTFYAFSKLAKLSFEKEKPHNPSLVVRVRALISTLEYDSKSEVDITTDIFQIGILLKRSRFFTFAYINQQFLKEV